MWVQNNLGGDLTTIYQVYSPGGSNDFDKTADKMELINIYSADNYSGNE